MLFDVLWSLSETVSPINIPRSLLRDGSLEGVGELSRDDLLIDRVGNADISLFFDQTQIGCIIQIVGRELPGLSPVRIGLMTAWILFSVSLSAN